MTDITNLSGCGDMTLIENAGLVLEGGGMRGLYTAGILDAFLDCRILFQNCIAVSAGICHACSYYCLQRGRAMHAVLDYLDRADYCGFGCLAKTGDFFGEKLVYHEIPEKLIPMDSQTFKKLGANLYSVVTNCDSGQPEYIKITDMLEDVDAVRASASLPLLARMVELNGKKYLDGGMSDSIPIKASEAMGMLKNVVILTQPRDYVKSPNKMYPLMKRKYSKYKYLLCDIKSRHEVYNDTLKYLAVQESEGNAMVIAPKESLGIGRIERDKGKLMHIYDIGYADGMEAITKIKTFVR